MKKGSKNKRVNLFEKSFEEVRNNLQTSTKRELQYEIDHFQDREWQSEQRKHCETPILHLDDPDHKMPSTRREFLQQGLIGTTLSVALPTILNPQVANALICPQGNGGADRLPILIIDGSGGASWAGDNIAVGSGYDATAGNIAYLDPADYSRFGVPEDQAPSAVGTIKPFGAASRMEFHPLSGMAVGISQTIGPTAAANTDGVTVTCASNDDTGNNNLSISQALVNIGYKGEIGGAVGTRTSASGGRSGSIMASATTQSTQARNQGQAAGLVDPGDLSAGLGNNNQSVELVLRQLASLTEAQTAAINAKSMSNDGRTAVVCGARDNVDNLAGKDLSNIYASNIIQTAFGGNPNNRTEEAVATGVYLALTGEVGVATVEIGGCDYHNRGRANQNAKDEEIGQAIGSAIRMAESANSPLMIYLLSDGSTSSNTTVEQGMYQSRSDNGNYASLHMIVYNPGGRVAVTQPQMGVYTANGVLQDGSVPYATSPDSAAKVIALNYMYLAGDISKVSSLGSLPGTVAELTAFGAPIVSSS